MAGDQPKNLLIAAMLQEKRAVVHSVRLASLGNPAPLAALLRADWWPLTARDRKCIAMLIEGNLKKRTRGARRLRPDKMYTPADIARRFVLAATENARHLQQKMPQAKAIRTAVAEFRKEGLPVTCAQVENEFKRKRPA